MHWIEFFEDHHLREDLVAWQVNMPTQQEAEETLEQYAELAQNLVVVH